MSLRPLLDGQEPFPLGNNVTWESIKAGSLDLQSLLIAGLPVGGSGVASLNGQQAAITLTSANASVGITTTTGNIDLSIAGAAAGVTSVNAVNGVMSLTSTDNTVTITPDTVAKTINLASGGVKTLVNGTYTTAVNNGLGIWQVNAAPPVLNVAGTGIVSVTSAAGTYTVASTPTSISGSGIATVTTSAPQVFNVDVPVGVSSLNSVNGIVNMTSTNASITITPDTVAKTIDLAAVFPIIPVTSVTGSGAATVTQPTPTVFNVDVPAPTVTNITGTGIATVTQPTTGVFNIDVAPGGTTISNGTNTVANNPSPGNWSIDASIPLTGSGAATVTTLGTGYNIDVPAPTVTNITGTGVATITSAGGIYNVDVPAPFVLGVTGSGMAVVTSAAGVYNVGVTQSVTSLQNGTNTVVSNPSVGLWQVDADTPVTGTGAATVTSVGTGYNVDVPVATVTNILGAGIASVTSAAGGVYTVDVPAPTLNSINSVQGNPLTGGDLALLSPDHTINIDNSTPNTIYLSLTGVTGTGAATVTTSPAGIINVDVPAPTVTNITGSGVAVVTNAAGVYNVNVPTPITWLAGGDYSNPNITVPVNTNTLISFQTITTTTTTGKYLIMAQFNATATAVGNIFATIGRSTASPTAANTTNLTDRVSALTNNISGNGLHMWVESSSTTATTIICQVIDTPGAIGTYYYSVWVRNAGGIATLTTELGNLSVLKILP